MDIDVVLVTYNPNRDTLIEVLKSIIINNPRFIYLIDNTPIKEDHLSFLKELFNNVCVIYLRQNFGIGYAQNVGIKLSLENQADFIWLSDQDTYYPPNFLKKMLKVFEKYSREEVAAIAPKIFDNTLNVHKPFIINFCFKKKNIENGFIEIIQAISSGLILNVNVLRKIGFMNEELFIDYVDLEWCWRAVNKGYKIIGNAEVSINHTLGDYRKTFLNFEVNMRTPLRHYYITRNTIYLSLRSKELPFYSRLILFVKSLKYFMGFSLLGTPHLENLKYTSLGFLHGFRGKLGDFYNES